MFEPLLLLALFATVLVSLLPPSRPEDHTKQKGKPSPQRNAARQSPVRRRHDSHAMTHQTKNEPGEIPGLANNHAMNGLTTSGISSFRNRR